MFGSDIEVAIEDRHLLQFRYDGFTRLVEPYAFGVSNRGRYTLRAYQVEGGSDSGRTEGWKLFHVADMESIVVTPRPFPAPRPEYRRDDRVFARIISQV
jgi:hypothetical protein